VKPVARLAAAILLCAPTLVSAQRNPAAQPAKPRIAVPFEKYALPNGLTVVLSPDRTTPTVAVVVMYHVGSKNEEVGRTGFAHLFEHVAFTGSKNVPYGMHDRYTQGVGGDNNGYTLNDYTEYYETVPSNYLEHVLWMESDRMGWLLEALDTAKYNAQREIVQNERRERVDNAPYGRSGEIVAAAIFPPSNPYSWPVLGSMADLQRAPIGDVKDFFRRYYAPNNATLTIAGDFEPAATRALVAKYFGEIKRGAPITRPRVAPTVVATEKRLVFEDRVQVPRLYLAWPVAGARSDDQYALDVLAHLLTGPRTARLTKDLVYDRPSAASVGAGNYTFEETGIFQIAITPLPAKSLTLLEAAADSVLEKIRREGVSAEEVKRVKAADELSFVTGLESNYGKASELARGQTYFNNPGYPFTTEQSKRDAVTAADVRRVANKYLTPGRVVLSVVPLGKSGEASKPESSTPVRGGQ
jgi:zinc protease